MARHQSINKTLELITRDFTQLRMRQDVTNYIRDYDICAKIKHSRYKLYELLQSLALLEQTQLVVVLDFIIKLSLSKKPLIDIFYNSILIIVDTLLKYIYLELYREAFTVEDLIYIFNKVVIARHDILNRIILNRDKLFTSQFQ